MRGQLNQVGGGAQPSREERRWAAGPSHWEGVRWGPSRSPASSPASRVQPRSGGAWGRREGEAEGRPGEQADPPPPHHTHVGVCFPGVPTLRFLGERPGDPREVGSREQRRWEGCAGPVWGAARQLLGAHTDGTGRRGNQEPEPVQGAYSHAV